MSSPRELLRPDTGVWLKEDFLSNDAVADATVGELGWEVVTIANASTIAYQTARGHGVVRLTTAATANGDGTNLRLFEDGLILTTGAEFGFRARQVTSLAGNNFRIGLTDSVTATLPTVGVWFDSDAGVLSCFADSADHGDNSLAVTGHPDLTSGTTLVVDTWYDFEARCSGKANAQGGPSEVDYFVNGRHVAKVPCAIDDDEEVEMKITAWQDSGGAAARIVEIDYFWLWIPRI